MAVRKVLCYPDQRLRTKAKPVEQFDGDIKQLADDLLETMYNQQGVGLAGTQIDVHQRILAIDVSDSRQQPRILINPELLEQHDFQPGSEGCLSFPGVFDKVERAHQIRYAYQDTHGERHEAQAEGLLAVCIQHEMDHLDGVLLVDHLSSLKRQRFLKKMRKQQKQTV